MISRSCSGSSCEIVVGVRWPRVQWTVFMAGLVWYDTLEVCLMTISKSPRRPCLMEGSVGVGIEIGIRKGPPKTDGIVSSVSSGVHGVSI